MEISENLSFKSCSNLSYEKDFNQGENDEITLSDHALKALHEFYEEQKLNGLSDADNRSSLVNEDWELSQFWYDEDTAETLKRITLDAAGETGRIACVSCPTVYTYLTKERSEKNDVYLFEYDRRFENLYSDNFIFYDYNNPLGIPEHFKSYFDVVIVDPPYLSQECLEKTSETIKHIAKDKIILCTGATMENLAYDLLALQPCLFQPQHKRKLGNEFKCYSNFDVDELIRKINQNGC